MIEAAWREKQLPAAFARLRQQKDNFFALATPEQLTLAARSIEYSGQRRAELSHDRRAG
jgi:hypothetical protein